MTASSDLTFKKAKVSDRGKISIQIEMHREMGIKEGDELLLIGKGRKIILEKPRKIAVILEDRSPDLPALSEESLKELGLGEGDEAWDRYLPDL